LAEPALTTPARSIRARVTTEFLPGGRSTGLTNFGTFNTADGNDTIEVGGFYTAISIYKDSIFDTGNGNDIIRGNSAGWSGLGIFNESITFNTGDGNDTIYGSGTSGGIANQGLINTGNGKDTIIADDGLINISTIDTGEGEDIITASNGFFNKGTIDTGDGDDIITGSMDYDVPGIDNKGTINTGNGNDSIIAEGLFIATDGTINTGDAKDSITSSKGIENHGTINTGNGADSILANGGFSGMGSVFLGNGKDYLKGFGTGKFNGGNHEDTLELTSGSYTIGISGATVSFTKSGVLMITSEFEKLIAGGTTHDFTSLTDGQTIVVA